MRNTRWNEATKTSKESNTMKPEPTRKTMHLPATTHAMLEQLRNMILKQEGKPLALTELIARLAEHEMDRLTMDKQPAQ
jgi:hypothetical protein